MFLPDDLLDGVRRVLAQHVPPNVAVFVFGSRAHGRNLKPFSDLDLCLRSGAPLPPDLVSRLLTAFIDSDLPIRVDVADWDSLSPDFQGLIAPDLRAVWPRETAEA